MERRFAQVVVTPDKAQQLRSISRTPQRVLGATSEGELRDALEQCLSGLFKFYQFELFTFDPTSGLIPVATLGSGQLGNGLKLLAALKGRKALRDEGKRLDAAQIFPKPQGVVRGSMLSAPLLDGERLLGLIVVEAPPRAADYTVAELELLEGVAALFSLAVQRLRYKALDVAHARIDRDLENARRVQRDLLSGSLPPGIGITATAEYLPSLEVGGDFYDFAHLGDGLVGSVIGDVSGKGVGAAMVMSRVSSEFRRFQDRTRSPAEMLREVNREMITETGETFTTASFFTIDAKARRLTVSSAGHVPLIVRRASGQVMSFGTASGTPLGMWPCEYDNESLDLDPGDIVIAMTDGLVEALDRPSDRMGMHLLHGIIRYAPHDPRAIIDRSLEVVNKMKGQKLLDDVTVVALQLDG